MDRDAVLGTFGKYLISAERGMVMLEWAFKTFAENRWTPGEKRREVAVTSQKPVGLRAMRYTC